MQYLVDGHNLIPKLGLRLHSQDDELELIAILQEFCRIRRAHVEVYFDGAPAGYAGYRAAGAVGAYFIRKGSSADAAIEIRLRQLGRAVKNWVVVSSDQRIQNAARSVHAPVVPSEDLARMISAARAVAALQVKTEGAVSPSEVDEWLQLFRNRG